MLLREANAAASTGPSRLSDPRRALSLMRHCAPRLPAAQLADRLAGWCQFLGGLLRAPRQQWCRDAACRTAACLLAEEARLEEAHRLLAGGALAQIVTPLLESPDQATLASLHCLRVVLLHFGRGCGAQRSQLTQYLLQLFDGEKPAVAWAACRCVALLPHTGPSGGGGAAYAAAWAGQMRGLLRAAHEHLDRLLDGVVEVRAYEVPERGEHELELPAVSADGAADPIRLRYRLARRVAAVCRVAALMLCSASKQPVTVPATALLELAQRCVSAGAAPVSAAMELQAARRAFWDVRAAALRMLEALIGCCGVSLVQRATALNGLLVSALQAPAAPRPSPAAEAAHRQALRTVRAWLTAAGAGCGLQDQAEKLITMLSEDTNPAATNGVTTNPSKKKRRGAGEWLEADLSARQSAPVARRPGRCLAALEVLCQLATALGPLLTVSAHRAAQQLCVGLLLEVQRATGAPPQPYDRPACRAGLYRLLRALVADPHPAWPAPVQFAVGLFAHGARDEDSTSSSSADGRRSVELAEMEEDQKSIVLGGSEDGEEESRPTARRPAPDESDEVEILET
ncbi:Proline-, glutamic acid- and leucine-rich protein 1 [Amphibalanus amphitrite]|uniref:Proline-, glutamic acid-and leucine-rich protein 1 n=1 Tax=Amphibalanus amphitrite TaxID=1232801 RepID=A0A6A4VN27_AMPAM|nr:Proline-, glutamic acid- and leucine-rich protein 1 [Amphibalanus amphitrite]